MGKRISKRILISLSVLIIFLGIALVGWNYFLSKKAKIYDTMSVQFSQIDVIVNPNKDVSDENLSDTNDELNNITNNSQTTSKPNQTTPSPTYNYIGYLEIPKISLKKGFVAINSVDNNVNKNIAIMPGSNYPDVENGLFIIAAHNGTCWNCYFRNLRKLSKGDTANIYYNNTVYTYKITNIYNVKKTGKVSIYRDPNQTVLALVTCTWEDLKNEQTVYIFEMI